VRHLLTHTSGLGDYPDDFPMQKDSTEDDELKMAMAQAPQSAPGDKWAYSNLGYLTLGALIHKVSGRFYGDLLAERVFGPLGMTRTRIISEADIVADRAAGYRLVNGEIKNQEWVAPTVNTTADGSLYFTALDLAKWDEALEQGKVVGRASYDAMWSPVKLNDGSTAPYGFGWGIQKAANGHRLIEHGGAWQGFTTYIARYPDDRLTVAVLCNLAGATPGYIAQRVAGMYEPALVPPPRKAIRLDPSKVKRFEGVYQQQDLKVTVLATGDAGELQITRAGRSRKIVPESDVDFFEEDAATTYRFVLEKGTVTGVEIALPEKILFKKMAAPGGEPGAAGAASDLRRGDPRAHHASCREIDLTHSAWRRGISSAGTSSLCVAMPQWCPNGSTTLPNRSPQNMSSTGMTTLAPASTARLNAASTSGT
jgi:hypothetical protein